MSELGVFIRASSVLGSATPSINGAGASNSSEHRKGHTKLLTDSGTPVMVPFLTISRRSNRSQLNVTKSGAC